MNRDPERAVPATARRSLCAAPFARSANTSSSVENVTVTRRWTIRGALERALSRLAPVSQADNQLRYVAGQPTVRDRELHRTTRSDSSVGVQ